MIILKFDFDVFLQISKLSVVWSQYDSTFRLQFFQQFGILTKIKDSVCVK
jgi:hypothetical protein